MSEAETLNWCDSPRAEARSLAKPDHCSLAVVSSVSARAKLGAGKPSMSASLCDQRIEPSIWASGVTA